MSIKSLDQTFIFSHLNSSGAIRNGIMEIFKNGQEIKSEQIEEALMIINKNFKYPMKTKTMLEYEKGTIKLMYAPRNVKLPSAMPFFLTQVNNQIVAIVMIDLYSSMDKDGNIKIDAKKLYCLMESAMVAKWCMESPSVITRPALIKEGSDIYSAMFVRVLNKKYALNIDKNRMQKVIFIASKFYLLTILGLKDNEITTNYAMRNCLQGNPIILNEVNKIVKYEDYKDLNSLISALKNPALNLGMSDLSVRSFLEAFISMYDASALLSLECLPYFLYNVFAVTNGAYLNNQYILEDIVDNKGARIYNDILYNLK